jgi:glycosyltransferase involved in cell wall biosynthesis
MSVTFNNGVNGFIHTNINYLIDKMKMLLNNRGEAERIGKAARETAKAMFGLNRFLEDWDLAFSHVIKREKVMEGKV